MPVDKTFICAGSDQGEIFINLYQIVRVDGMTDDAIILHMSDGATYNIHGSEAVNKITALLAEHSMTLDGEPLMNHIADRVKLGDSGISLVKPEREL
jgi:hypothetical protein